MISKIFQKILNRYLKRIGFKPYMASHFSQAVVKDMKNKDVPFSKKIWAYKRGFLSHRMIDYKLNEENYKDYLSDYDYYRIYPLNGQQSVLINDKMSTKYALAPFDEFMPAYYYILKNGEVIKMMNADKDSEGSIENVISKIRSEKAIAFKKIAAAGGDGFYKIEFVNNEYLINGQAKSEKELYDFLMTLNDYLAMEYIIPHDDIRKYYPNSTGVLRIMVINEGKPIIANAYIRVGSTICGYIDAYTGSISAVVNLETGEYKNAYMHNGLNFIKVDLHPDAKIPFEGIIPKWEYVKEKILEISNYLPQLNYLGFDVCVTEKGFKIFEINSHQGIELYQLDYPLLKDNLAADFFKKAINNTKKKKRS